jgi:hypothetical protein
MKSNKGVKYLCICLEEECIGGDYTLLLQVDQALVVRWALICP